MDYMNLSERIDKHFPLSKSNRGYPPSKFTKTFILMQHEGSFHLDEVRHIQDDEALWACRLIQNQSNFKKIKYLITRA